MSESKHSPAPWTVDNFEYPEPMIRAHGRHWAIGGVFKAHQGCTDPSRDTSEAEAKANARLIAAAPELLEAAKPLDLSGWFSHGVLSDPASDLVRIRIALVGTTYEHEVSVGQLRALSAAIAKASGEAA